jgi:hypothetical protein
MSSSQFTLPKAASMLPDLAAFALGLGCAWAFEWTTTDLVWSLWLSSLVIGYASILIVIGKGMVLGSAAIFGPGVPARYRVWGVPIGLAVAGFVLAFFSFHFCGFHAVHGSILSYFFPLSGLPRGELARGFFNPILLWKEAFHYMVPKYGLFLIPVAIAERRMLLGSKRALQDARPPDPADGIAPALKASGPSRHDLFARPYANVVRMHLLIFFFFICHALKIASFPVYAVVYSVYFFPWSDFRKSADA